MIGIETQENTKLRNKSEFDKEGQTYETLWNAKARDR